MKNNLGERMIFMGWPRPQLMGMLSQRPNFFWLPVYDTPM